MFFLASKALSFLLNPLAHWIFFVLALFACAITKQKSRTIWIVFIIHFFIIGVSPLPSYWLWQLESTYPPVKQPVKKQAAVILGGATIEWHPSFDQFSWGKSTGRVMEAIRLYLNGHVDKLVITGKRFDIPDNIVGEAPAFAKLTSELGIPRKDVILEPLALNTYQNALRVQALLKKHKIEDFYLVTSASHMHRSLKVFEKLGMQPAPFAVSYKTMGIRDRIWEHWGLYNSFKFQIAIHEYVGYLAYKMMGYL